VAADEQGRIRPESLRETLAGPLLDEPVIVWLQAGNPHSGASDPFSEAIALTQMRGAWVHVDGAFGLWAAAEPRLRRPVAGVADADSWATDPHKTPNTAVDTATALADGLRGFPGATVLNDVVLTQSGSRSRTSITPAR